MPHLTILMGKIVKKSEALGHANMYTSECATRCERRGLKNNYMEGSSLK